MDNYRCPHCNKVFPCNKNGDSLIICPLCNGIVLLPSEDFKQGDIIGGFEIVRPLGKGGMGNVYLAKQISMQRLVALKVLSQSLIKEQNILDQFKKEVQLSGKLNHTNIITAIDAGSDKGTFYLAVNYIDGEDYEHRLNREFAIPEKEALNVALTISDALKYAWDKHKLIHKDIKPGNIIKDKRGEVFLMDLGIAQKIGYMDTSSEFILGSPFYMSPEQGQGLELDWQTDLYSLGATLYHMIIGLPPYDAEDLNDIIHKHVYDPFPEPKSRNPNAKISIHALNLIKKSMEKKPENRFKSWDDFRKSVQKILSIEQSTKTNTIKSSVRTQRIPLNPSASKTVGKRGASTSVSIGKPKDPAMQMLNYAVIIITAIVFAFFIRSCRKSSSARKSIEYADQYIVKYPNDWQEIVRLYKLAIDESRGTGNEREAVDKYNSAIDAQKNYLKEVEIFETKMIEVERLVGKKDYQKARELLRTIKNIPDPLQRQRVLGLSTIIENTLKSEND